MTLLTGTHLGLLAGLIFGLTVTLIHFFPRYQWSIASGLLIFITPLALGGFWFSDGQWGISDWDYYFSLHHTHRDIILNYHQFPWWNPVTCGGAAGLADPEFSVLTPTFLLFELPFGIPTGVRLAIFFATAAGAIGMLLLGKRLGLSSLPALLTAIAYAFSSVNLLEIVEGHVNIFAAMYLPWILWSWLAAYQELTYRLTWKKITTPRTLICALFLALTFYQGGIYLLMYTAIAFLFLPLLTRRPLHAYRISISAGLIALGLAAFKLIPVILWLRQFQDTAYASSTTTLPYLYDIFLGRHLHGAANVIPNQGSGWHEYGAYLGPVIVSLAFIGAITSWPRRLTTSLVIATIAAILLSSAGPWLKLIFDAVPFIPRSNISRFVIFAVIPLSLLAGFGLHRIEQWRRVPKIGRILAHLLLTAAALDLMSLAYPLSQQAFILSPVYPVPSPAPSPLAFTTRTFETRVAGVDYTRAYAATLAGYGTLNYCTSIGPTPQVRTIFDEGDNEIVAAHHAHQSHLNWTPNRVQVAGVADTTTEVILNTNYAAGWQVNHQVAKEIAGRVGVHIPPGPFNLTFRYRAPGVLLGSLITISTLAAIILSTTKRPQQLFKK